ncbi:hypothetical protein EDEG_03981 [Edhazardia aedis USNM 41457]|uniref:Uncharacterized protein n=1 Tax=Edhazardia aedis (strain USNM 41457) TaxID=1003232 RepID=J9DJ22_EDHAE|nr:hypothetical protein EDEG_03981 [Edhazardia aedis USNM 41457]|eukprot:EJW01387.1 hypothetical protein EDEG_03981 [Edhazardia aedis USNM 41457]
MIIKKMVCQTQFLIIMKVLYRKYRMLYNNYIYKGKFQHLFSIFINAIQFYFVSFKINTDSDCALAKNANILLKNPKLSVKILILYNGFSCVFSTCTCIPSKLCLIVDFCCNTI